MINTTLENENITTKETATFERSCLDIRTKVP